MAVNMKGKDIFSALAKYNSAADENYLTEAFVFVVEFLLMRERSIGLNILNNLCVENNEFSFGADEKITVKTQVSIEQGTPDIKIASPDKLIYVEVKHDSPLGYDQISRYKKALESSVKSIKYVVLLTRFAVDFDEEQERPYKHVRWFEVYNWLANIEAKAKDPISIYLTESFKSFLEAKQMTIQKVDWEYIKGMPAFNNLINMLEAAIKGAGVPFYQASPKSYAWDSKAFWLENKKYWCGIYYDKSLVVVFKAFHKRDLDMKRVEAPSYPVKEALESIWFKLQLEDKHFFSLDKDGQLEVLTEFVKTAYAEAKQMRKKGSNPI